MDNSSRCPTCGGSLNAPSFYVCHHEHRGGNNFREHISGGAPMGEPLGTAASGYLRYHDEVLKQPCGTIGEAARPSEPSAPKVEPHIPIMSMREVVEAEEPSRVAGTVSTSPFNWQDLYQRTEDALLALRVELGGQDYKTNALDHITVIRRQLLELAEAESSRLRKLAIKLRTALFHGAYMYLTSIPIERRDKEWNRAIKEVGDSLRDISEAALNSEAACLKIIRENLTQRITSVSYGFKPSRKAILTIDLTTRSKPKPKAKAKKKGKR